MSNNHSQEKSESDLPIKLSNPARRALIGAGYTRLEQLTRLTETEVLKLHGMGPKAIDQLKQALAAKGMSFANKS
ncbi:DNA-directed RNA polymerase subunit alpha C-terminal domain-containing protein [Paenibacillus sp. FSL H7-0331]|uniref:DNA-directed RNA polymerase subunit alpha C-terminal domain-containing protein n=1 Tax=Paenibacillus sp. FSL H7-0331 TaxID=1920421 RepID=UPI00096BEA7D|nr:DNA-directed RNA polymerase subunit alpha C-terminal domain-containing protein [Paenibacillus sp. FSL H7-0331]OMF04418.1 DNA-binding protein [Paenibacillus sp. FSL H7-0331]